MKLAIVPARGGSKRIKSKNIIDFFGKPMIAYTLGSLRDAGLFDVIHVSTESAEIAAIVSELGFPTDFLRPQSLAGDDVATMPVLQWVLREYAARGMTFDTVACMYPCAPLIEGDDIVDAHRIFAAAGGLKPLQCIATLPCPIERAYHRKPDGSLAPVVPGANKIKSQDLETAYYDAGAFYFFSAAHIDSELPATDADYTSYELSRLKAVDINTDEDLALARALYAVRRAAKG